jgi:hypothetical protein
VRRWCGEFAGTQQNEIGVVAEVEVLVDDEPTGWLQVVEGLQYGLHQLILHSNQLLKVDGVVAIVVDVARLAVALVVPCVHHLMG